MKIFVAYKKETAKDGLGKREKVLGQASGLSELIKTLKASSTEAAIYECEAHRQPDDEDTLFVTSEKLVQIIKN